MSDEQTLKLKSKRSFNFIINIILSYKVIILIFSVNKVLLNYKLDQCINAICISNFRQIAT